MEALQAGELPGTEVGRFDAAFFPWAEKEPVLEGKRQSVEERSKFSKHAGGSC